MNPNDINEPKSKYLIVRKGGKTVAEFMATNIQSGIIYLQPYRNMQSRPILELPVFKATEIMPKEWGAIIWLHEWDEKDNPSDEMREKQESLLNAMIKYSEDNKASLVKPKNLDF